MALLWMDGFDAYGTSSTPNVEALLNSAGYMNAVGVALDTGTRSGTGSAVRINETSVYTNQLRKAFDTKDEIVLGFAVKIVPGTLNNLVEVLYDNLFGSVTAQLGVYANGVGGLSISIDGSNMLAASQPNVFFPNVWHYLEMRYKPSHTDGVVQVRLDGVDVITYTGKTCPDGTPAKVNTVRWITSESDHTHSTASAYGTQWIDDLYICDTLGAELNDFLGDVQVIALLPSADAGPNDMSVYGGSVTHASAVNEVPANDGASYLYSNIAGDTEMFTVPALPATIMDVLAVSTHCRVRKDAPGASSIKLRATVNGSAAQSDDLALTTVYTSKVMIMPSAPDSGAWTKEKVAGMTIGVELA
jgi:hypothetical protein